MRIVLRETGDVQVWIAAKNLRFRVYNGLFQYRVLGDEVWQNLANFLEYQGDMTALKNAAEQAAQTATQKASEASASAQTATTKASEASASAQTATTKASEASASAQTATTKASEASTSAQTATQKANEASTSAQTATVNFEVVNTIADRDAIPNERRKVGKIVKVLADGITYCLKAGIANTDWKVDSISVEFSATYETISTSTNKRFVHVESDSNNNNLQGLYYHNGQKLGEILVL